MTEATEETTEQATEETTEQTTEETTLAVRAEDVHKSWKHASDKLSGKKSAPDAYEFNFSEDIPEELLEGLDSESDYVKSLIEIAKDSDMDQEGFDRLLNLTAKDEFEKEQAVQAEKARELDALGEHASRRIKDVKLWLDASLPSHLADALKGAANSAAIVEAMEGLISSTKNPTLPKEDLSSEVVSIHDDLRKRQFAKDENGNRLMQNKAYAQAWRDDCAASGFTG